MIDKKNLFLIFFVLLVASIIGFWIPYSRLKNSPDLVKSENNSEMMVEYTKDGFLPKSLTVTVGVTVAWVNRSGRPMWVGSDPHPAHTNLPGFDQRRIINRLPSIIGTAYAHGDGIYEYTFTKIGTWRYHNHINPIDRGEVIVVKK